MPSKANYLIVHGCRGSPEGNWFPWLNENLQNGGTVFLPRFPTPESQSLASWRAVAKKALANCEPANTIFVGHSTGAVFVLRLAEETKQPFKAVFSICPFARALGLPDFDPLNASFVSPSFDWPRVRQGARKIVCFAGDNDPYVPLAASREVADRSGAEFIVVKNGGHLNAESGFHEFPQLLKKIRSVVTP